MYRRKREPRELAGWQCRAGRAILQLEAVDFAPLALTSKNTILRFESGEFMPRPHTVLEIDRVFRQHGIFCTFSKEGEPKGINIGWQAYGFCYPDRPVVMHRPVEAKARALRQHPPPPDALRSWKGVDPDVNESPDPKLVRVADRGKVAEHSPAALGDKAVNHGDIAALEAQAARLMAELTRLKAQASETEEDF